MSENVYKSVVEMNILVLTPIKISIYNPNVAHLLNISKMNRVSVCVATSVTLRLDIFEL